MPDPTPLEGFAFAADPLDRADALRGDAVALRALWPDARLLVLHIEGQGKKDVLAAAEADGPEEDMPIRAIFRQRRTPVEFFWAP